MRKGNVKKYGRLAQTKQPVGINSDGLFCLCEDSKFELVTSLGGVIPYFVHFAIRAFMDDLWRRIAQRQYSVRHDPRLDQDRVLNGHLVKDLIALPSQPFNHVHVGGVEQAAASEPGCIDE